MTITGRRIGAAAVVAAVLALTSACQLAGDRDLTGEPTPAPSGDAQGGDAAGGDGPRTIPPQLQECGEGAPSEGELQLADLDLRTAEWSTPTGFTEASGYHEDNPVEELHSAWYAEPTDPAIPRLNVIQVVIYTGLDWDDLADSCGRVPLEAVEEQLGRYREQIDAEPLSESEMTEVAGQPAITQQIGLERYSYVGYWLFSQDQLLHAYCQWTDESAREVIEPACTPLVESITVG
ncbi:hypothetical protein [Ruania halotolerans]|uniref:hypothetical protein n=1 Tax=Ruania halotolerans TaxID=2897773 RepID=UPI001E594072|nr:hypothetical protein [Ruania halotolerans]UFU08102.1 hypothetical protein LQF10_08405 [Ruania halotolerans]